MGNLKKELAEAGAGMEDVVKLFAYIVMDGVKEEGIDQDKIIGVARSMNAAFKPPTGQARGLHLDRDHRPRRAQGLGRDRGRRDGPRQQALRKWQRSRLERNQRCSL